MLEDRIIVGPCSSNFHPFAGGKLRPCRTGSYRIRTGCDAQVAVRSVNIICAPLYVRIVFGVDAFVGIRRSVQNVSGSAERRIAAAEIRIVHDKIVEQMRMCAIRIYEVFLLRKR